MRSKEAQFRLVWSYHPGDERNATPALRPTRVAVYFIFQRQIPGTPLAVFFFFENYLNIATSMAEARRQELPLLTVGDAD